MRLAAALCISWLAAGAAFGAVRPSPPEVNARAHVLVDYRSGALLASHNPDQRHEPASLTKMMTAYVVFSELRAGNIRLDDMVLVSEKAWRAPGSRMFIEVGDRVSVEQLLMGVIIQSGNDASIALAEHVAGDESAFADLMNRHAQGLGMHDSNFTNSSGLPDPDLYTTPRDMATIARALVREFPDYYKWHAIKSFEYNGIEQKNRNRLLWQDESVDGLKTGYTRSAGYCLVASAAARGHAPGFRGDGIAERQDSYSRHGGSARVRVPCLRYTPCVRCRRGRGEASGVEGRDPGASSRPGRRSLPHRASRRS